MARNLNSLQAGLAAILLVSVSGCASVPAPAGEMATAQAAVENARREGAGQLAQMELTEAQDKLTQAERAQAGKEFASARRAAEQARVMAELAAEKARLAKAAQAKDELDKTMQALRGQTVAPASR